MAKPPLPDVAKGNPRAASTRLELRSAHRLGGQRKHDLRIGRQPAYVDPLRREDNRLLIDPATPAVMRRLCADRRALRDTQRAMKRNAAVAACGVITFGAEAAELFERLEPSQQDAAFTDLAEAIAERLNTTLHGLVIHLDETTIHAHYQLAAYNRDGVPLSKATSPRVMSGLQDLTAEVMGRHCPGIERGHQYGGRIEAGADFRDTLHRTVRQLHQDLPREIDEKRAQVAEASARVDEMRERVAKLEDKAELTDKETKRLGTYKKRLEDRIKELEDATKEEERLAEIAREDADAAARQRDESRGQEKAARDKATRIEAAVKVLAAEIRDETITRNDAGKIIAGDPSTLKGGFPELRPSVHAAADAISEKKKIAAKIEEDRQKTKQALDEANDVLQQALTFRDVLQKTIGSLKALARRFGLTGEPAETVKKAVGEAEELIRLTAPKIENQEPEGPGL